jgi:hypothetical protein
MGHNQLYQIRTTLFTGEMMFSKRKTNAFLYVDREDEMDREIPAAKNDFQQFDFQPNRLSFCYQCHNSKLNQLPSYRTSHQVINLRAC